MDDRKTPICPGSRYYRTFIGEGGDLGRLIRVLKSSARMDGHGRIGLASGRFLYLAVEEEDRVELDFYHPINKSPGTHTQVVKNDIGNVCILMMQTSYKVSSLKIEGFGTEPEEPEVELDF